MATIRPFRALRPDPAKAAEVCSPPYDVVSTEEAAALAEGKPHCFLRVTRPEIELPAYVDPHSDEAYLAGRAKLVGFVKERVLIADKEPCLYIYRLRHGAHEQTGVAATFSCKEYRDDIIKKHELTRPDKEDDRKHHIDILGAQTGPVFLTYQASKEVDAVVATQVLQQPAMRFTADDGVEHTLWKVSDPDAISWMQAAFASVPAVYIADGHHRAAAANRVCEERAAATPGHKGDEPHNFFLGVAFPHTQMRILGYHRVLKDLNGLEEGEFFASLEEWFRWRMVDGPVDPPSHGTAMMYTNCQWYHLDFIHDDRTPRDVVAMLDASFLQEHLLDPVLGIENPRTDKRITFVGGARGLKELQRLVDTGEWTVAFAMHPTSIEELMAVSDAHCLMPPKSTWFEPKLRDGVVTHVL